MKDTSKDEMLQQAHQQIIALEKTIDDMGVEVRRTADPEECIPNMTADEASDIGKSQMPKEMSEWFDKNIKNGNSELVNGFGKIGQAIKSRDCTVIIVPSRNCDAQFANIVNDLRVRGVPKGWKPSLLQY